MPLLTELHRPSLLMLTDFYQLTMAAAAWGSGAARRETVWGLRGDLQRRTVGTNSARWREIATAARWIRPERRGFDDLRPRHARALKDPNPEDGV